MTTAPDHLAGPADARGGRWSAGAGGVTAFEPRMLALYEAALDDLLIHDGTPLLDVGCGAGFFLRLAAQRGATVTGIDADGACIAIARERLPDADLTVGELASLPYEDDSFAIVTAFNALQFAADPPHALREVRRVARPRAPVIIAAWGRPEQCEAAAYVKAVGGLLPPSTSGAAEAFTLSEDGALEAFVAGSGLNPVERRDVFCVWGLPDEDSAVSALGSSRLALEAAAHAGDDELTTAILGAIAPYRMNDGGYRLENTFTYLIAQA